MKKLITLLTLAFCLNGKAQIITTVAGCGGSGLFVGGYSGDGGLADTAHLYDPCGVAFDSHGNIYISDLSNNKIRKIDTNGIISTFASASEPWGIIMRTGNNLYVANFSGGISKFDSLGNGTAVVGGLFNPSAVAFDNIGNMFIAETWNNRVRKLDTAGVLSTIAGNGPTSVAGTYSGDGGLATQAGIVLPMGVAVDANNNVYVSDRSGRIRMINSAGIINTVVGGGSGGLGDGGPAIAAQLVDPYGITFDVQGNLYITEYNGYRIRKVNTNGIISTVAGNGYNAGAGPGGFDGDGGLAINAELYNPTNVAFDSKGIMYIADEFNNRIRKVSLPLTITVNSDTICAGQTTTLTASGAYTYTWSPSIGLSDTIGSMVIASPTVTTTYTVVGTKGDSMGLATSIVTINAISVNSLSVCIGAIDTLRAASATTCTWSTGSTNLSIIVSPTVTTTYTVSGTAGTCTSIATTTVTVNSLPGITTPTITPTNCGLCNGSYIATGTDGSGTYYYALNGAVYYSYSVPSYSLCAGVYYFAAVDSVTGCYSPTQIFTITTIGSPTVSFSLIQDTIPHTWDAYPTYSANVDSAKWHWGDGTSTTGLYSSHTYASSGWYNICVTAFDSCGDSANYCQNDTVYRLANNSPYSSMVYVNVKSGTSGISQISGLNSNISIYPNPNNGSFVVEPKSNSKQTIQVYNVNGKLVLSQTISSKTNIDASSLNEGVYNIGISSNEGVVNKRLVIVK